ncbi:MAG TPA: hypothetical protein VFR24_09900 [Candidatus Angelobacter sp.]|nr:hypothetical protein [Candidatus Angelobacter sp.]
MYYLVAFVSLSYLVVMLALARKQDRFRRSQEDIFGLVPLMLPVDRERMRELFDPAEEWNLRARSTPEAFKAIQSNRRRLAIQYASHMYRNAGLLQRLGGAGMRRGRRDEVLLGKMLLDAGVAVRMRCLLLLAFLRFQQLVYTASYLNSIRDIVKDLLPDYDEMLTVAFDLSQALDANLHRDLMQSLS